MNKIKYIITNEMYRIWIYFWGYIITRKYYNLIKLFFEFSPPSLGNGFKTPVLIWLEYKFLRKTKINSDFVPNYSFSRNSNIYLSNKTNLCWNRFENRFEAFKILSLQFYYVISSLLQLKQFLLRQKYNVFYEQM